MKGGAWQTVTHNSKMPHDKSSQHDTNVIPSPIVTSDKNSQLENTLLIEQSHLISSNHSIQPSEMHTKVSNSSSSTSTTENNIYVYDKTTENFHTDNNNIGSSESGKYDILMLHDLMCREIDIQRLLRNSKRKGFKQVSGVAAFTSKRLCVHIIWSLKLCYVLKTVYFNCLICQIISCRLIIFHNDYV